LEWQSLLRLAAILSGMGSEIDIAAFDDQVMRQRIEFALRDPASPLHGRDADEIMAALEPRRGLERAVDFMLRSGPHGEGFGARPGGLSLTALEAAPHGVDLGPLEPRIPEILRTPSGKIELAPELIVADLTRLEAALERPAPGLVLVGRRDVRSK